jgi:TonB family protein
LLALLSSGAGALAQKPTQERTPAADGRGQRVVITTVPPDAGNVVISRSGDGYSFAVIEPELNFDGHVVKGAPYSAEAVTESVQPLADGNRIVRKSAAVVYRDAEGRTRREQSMTNVGPFATAGDAPPVIFINDPVAGVGYTLDARTHTARKTSGFAFGFGPPPLDGPAGGLPFKRPAPPEPGMPPPAGVELRVGPGGARPAPPLPPGEGGLRQSATKRIQPQYPPIAKAAGAEGLVAVQVVIDEQGNVASARAVSGHPLLRDASVDAARQWVFKPTVVNGKPAKVSGVITFSFVLDDKEEGGPPPPDMPSLPRREPVKEPLGRQTVEGVEADGVRETFTIPAGELGNERPINIVTERWYSPDLQVVVMSRHSDPRFGETTYRLTNINRAAPARSLFEVPSDYTIKEQEPARHEFRMRRQP